MVIFPSTLAYLFFNRGIALIGPNRAAPFFHLMPVFGSAMAILLLGEQPRLFHLVGYVLVLAGVVIASRRASARRLERPLRRSGGFRFCPGQASVPGKKSIKTLYGRRNRMISLVDTTPGVRPSHWPSPH